MANESSISADGSSKDNSFSSAVKSFAASAIPAATRAVSPLARPMSPVRALFSGRMRRKSNSGNDLVYRPVVYADDPVSSVPGLPPENIQFNGRPSSRGRKVDGVEPGFVVTSPHRILPVDTGYRPSSPENLAGPSFGQPYGISRKVDLPQQLIGRGLERRDLRKYRYDISDIPLETINFRVTRDDRLSVEVASEMLERLHETAGLRRGVYPAAVYAGFDAALWFCHTINGASRMTPGRSTFCVPGITKTFKYLDVIDQLGVDARRFFRAYADDIADVNRRVLAEYDPNDPESHENWAWLMEVATERGLTRFPYLAHDSADACLRLNFTERAVLAESKVTVLSNTVNVADHVHANSRVRTLSEPESS